MSKESFIGIYCNGSKDGYRSYTFEEIKSIDYIDFINDRSGTLEAVFRISDENFGTGIKWGLKQPAVVYVDSIQINSSTKDVVIYDVVSDMIVECALSKQAKVVRVKVEKTSIIGYVVCKNGYQQVEKNGEYLYMEVDAAKYREDKI